MRRTIERLDSQFTEIHQGSVELLSRLSSELLYANLGDRGHDSCGEQILRSAAVMESSFGGLTVNLWDDPFEWTLPETLSTPAKVLEYLDEVEATRVRAFATFQSDEDLEKEIMSPSGPVQLQLFLLDTLKRARHHQQRAIALAEVLRPEQFSGGNLVRSD